MRSSVILSTTTALVMGIAAISAGQDAQAQQPAKAKSDAELIENAISAAPAAISKDATIIIVEGAGKLRTLRQGQGAFTCIPDDPNTPGHDPMCLDRNGLEWFKALLAHASPPQGKIWVGYMLKGSSDPSSEDPYATEPPAGKSWVEMGPHVMIGGPGVSKMLDGYAGSAGDMSKAHIMFGGTPYEYLALPVQ